MRRGTAISVDDDFAARQPGIPVRPANNKRAGGVYEKLVVIAHPAVGQNIFDKRPTSPRTSSCVSSASCWVETTTEVAVTGRPFS